MMLTDVESTRKELEKEELSSPDGIAGPEVYTKLMVCYLLENDLCNAKFLWKRAPATVKDADSPLAALWTIGQKLWTKDYPATYVTMRREWPEYLRQSLTELEGSVRERALALVCRAYTSITLTDLAGFVGLPPEETARLVSGRGWTLDGSVVGPKPPAASARGDTNCEQSLAVLTQCVSFLEN